MPPAATIGRSMRAADRFHERQQRRLPAYVAARLASLHHDHVAPRSRCLLGFFNRSDLPRRDCAESVRTVER